MCKGHQGGLLGPQLRTQRFDFNFHIFQRVKLG